MHGYVTVAHFAPPVPTMLQVDACVPCRGGDACEGAEPDSALPAVPRSRVLHEQVGPDDMIALIFSYPFPGSIPVPSSDPAGPPSGVPRACRRHAWNPRPAATKARSPWTWSGHTSRLPRRASRGSLRVRGQNLGEVA